MMLPSAAGLTALCDLGSYPRRDARLFLPYWADGELNVMNVGERTCEVTLNI
jgi:hypothetical protein